MFTVKCDGHLLFDLKKHIVLTNPKLHIAENAAGSLEFDIAPTHPMYDAIESMVSEIVVYQDGSEIWSGRATEQKTNFFGMKSVYCEGELSYLCDTIQPPSEVHYTVADNVAVWLNDLLTVHNSKAPADKRFYVGTVTVTEADTLYRYTNYESTLDCISEKLIKRLGGHLRIRKVSGKRYLDYLAEYPGTASQSIRFGLNLLEYSKTLTRADIATVVVPLGAKQEEKDFDALEKYLDVSSVNNGSIYVENSSAVSSFGRINKVVHWDDVSTASALLRKAQEWISDKQYDDLKLEVNALDFHLVDSDVPVIHLLDEVRVVSAPHGMDKWFPVTELDIPLDNPAQMVFTLGTSERVSLTARTNAAINAIEDDLETFPSDILQRAKNTATDLITSGALGGYVTVLPNEIYVADSDDITAAKKVWRWNLNGLGYSKTGIDGKYGLAITMDGAIVADYITLGTMTADRIRGGKLLLGGYNNKNGLLIIQNASGTEIVRGNASGITVKNGGTVKTQGSTSFSELIDGNIKIGYQSEDVGRIGGVVWENTDYTGLQFGLFPNAEFTMWAYQTKSGGIYYPKLLYTKVKLPDTAEADTLNAFCDFNFHDKSILRAKITSPTITDATVNSITMSGSIKIMDGSAMSIYNDVDLQIYCNLDMNTFEIQNAKLPSPTVSGTIKIMDGSAMSIYNNVDLRIYSDVNMYGFEIQNVKLPSPTITSPTVTDGTFTTPTINSPTFRVQNLSNVWKEGYTGSISVSSSLSLFFARGIFTGTS